MKPTNKNPYEIRLDLLQLAFDILVKQHAAKAAAHHGQAVDTAPTSDDVVAEATKLNEFISSNKHNY